MKCLCCKLQLVKIIDFVGICNSLLAKAVYFLLHCVTEICSLNLSQLISSNLVFQHMSAYRTQQKQKKV